MRTVFYNAFIPDFKRDTFYKSNVLVEGEVIKEISDTDFSADLEYDINDSYIVPGLMDCHVHIESSHLSPSKFGNLVAGKGTLHLVTDNHEIANVGGMEALEYFFNDSYGSFFCNIRFAVPSCVPATDFSTSGASLSSENVCKLLERKDVVALGELMDNYGVINSDDKFSKMIERAYDLGKVVNGHAPGLSGANLKKYIRAGVMDDHESESYGDIKEKLESGMFIFLREGSAEHTSEEAYKLIDEYPEKIMFCTDDKSVNHIIDYGHIDYNLNKALKLGVSPINALKAAGYNGLRYYGMSEYAEIKPGAAASFIVCDMDKDFVARDIFVEGRNIKDIDKTVSGTTPPSSLLSSVRLPAQKTVPAVESETYCIKANDGSIVTEKTICSGETFDTEKDILKLCIFERYGKGNKTACKIKGFNIKRGGMASSIAHDSHNIIAVGASDDAVLKVVNSVIENQGGLSVFDGQELYTVPLELGGLIANSEERELYENITELNRIVKRMNVSLTDPFGTLSFMALEVIPHLKLTDQGLFDVDNFTFVKD